LCEFGRTGNSFNQIGWNFNDGVVGEKNKFQRTQFGKKAIELSHCWKEVSDNNNFTFGRNDGRGGARKINGEARRWRFFVESVRFTF
jgi:hypothetical protein